MMGRELVFYDLKSRQMPDKDPNILYWLKRLKFLSADSRDPGWYHCTWLLLVISMIKSSILLASHHRHPYLLSSGTFGSCSGSCWWWRDENAGKVHSYTALLRCNCWNHFYSPPCWIPLTRLPYLGCNLNEKVAGEDSYNVFCEPCRHSCFLWDCNRREKSDELMRSLDGPIKIVQVYRILLTVLQILKLDQNNLIRTIEGP